MNNIKEKIECLKYHLEYAEKVQQFALSANQTVEGDIKLFKEMIDDYEAKLKENEANDLSQISIKTIKEHCEGKVKRDDLALANKIDKEIRELDKFIYTASKVWGGKLISKEEVKKKKVWRWEIVNKASRLIFKSNSYGVFNSKEYVMSKEVRKKVLIILEEYKQELEKKLESKLKELSK